MYAYTLPILPLISYFSCIYYNSVQTFITLNAPIATKEVCFSHLLKCLRSLCGKQCGPRSDCSHRSSLIWVLDVCFYTSFVSNARQLFAADDFSRRHFQMHFFLGALRFNILYHMKSRLGVKCNKIDKPLVVYRFRGSVMTSITTLRT